MMTDNVIDLHKIRAAMGLPPGEPAPKFRIGDRVRLQGDHRTWTVGKDPKPPIVKGAQWRYPIVHGITLSWAPEDALTLEPKGAA